jgi:low temperature requirement protein LtrA
MRGCQRGDVSTRLVGSERGKYAETSMQDEYAVASAHVLRAAKSEAFTAAFLLGSALLCYALDFGREYVVAFAGLGVVGAVGSGLTLYAARRLEQGRLSPIAMVAQVIGAFVAMGGVFWFAFGLAGLVLIGLVLLVMAPITALTAVSARRKRKDSPVA